MTSFLEALDWHHAWTTATRVFPTLTIEPVSSLIDHLESPFKEYRQSEAVVRLRIVNVQTLEQILLSGWASNAVIYVGFLFGFF